MDIYILLLLLIVYMSVYARRHGWVIVNFARSEMHSVRPVATSRHFEIRNTAASSADTARIVPFLLLMPQDIYTSIHGYFSIYRDGKPCSSTLRNPIEILMFEIRNISMFLHVPSEQLSKHYEVDGVAARPLNSELITHYATRIVD